MHASYEAIQRKGYQRVQHRGCGRKGEVGGCGELRVNVASVARLKECHKEEEGEGRHDGVNNLQLRWGGGKESG